MTQDKIIEAAKAVIARWDSPDWQLDWASAGL